MQLRSISFESPQVDFFFDKMQIFGREKKNQNSKHYPASCLVRCHLTDSELQSPCKPLSAWRAEVANSAQLQPQPLVWGSLGIPCWQLGLDAAAFPQTMDFCKGWWC